MFPEACPTHPAAASSLPADGVSSKKSQCWVTPTATPDHKGTFVLVPSTLNSFVRSNVLFLTTWLVLHNKGIIHS